MSIKNTLAVVMIAVAVVVSGGAAVATAQEDPPGEPASFYGSVGDADGTSAPAGTTIYAVAIAEDGGTSVEGSITVETVGEYGGSDATDEKLRVDSNAGTDVRFHVGSADGPQSQSTYDLESGVYEQDLTFPSGTFGDTDDSDDDGDSDDSDSDDGDSDDSDTDDGDSGDSGNGGDDGGSGGSGDSDDSGGGGGGGGGGSFGPSITASTGISDAAPDTPGTTVEFDNGAVNAITFSREDAEGRVEVDDYGTNPPSGSPSTGNRPVFASVEITVPDSVANEPATIRMTVDQSELLRANVAAEDIAVLRGTGSGYQTLDVTDVESNGDVTIEAETPGFSTFIVSTDEGDIEPDNGAGAVTDTPADETPVDDGNEDDDRPATDTDTPVDGTPPADSNDLPGFGVPIALVALLAAALLAGRRNRK